MRSVIVIVSCALIAVFAGAGAVQGGQPAFFEALYDVPVMPGLKELPDQAMLFDKPDGRIASVVAVSETLSLPAVETFYGQSLPQLGWKKTGQNQYVRGQDQLSVQIVREAALTVLRLTLSPLKAPPGSR